MNTSRFDPSKLISLGLIALILVVATGLGGLWLFRAGKEELVQQSTDIARLINQSVAYSGPDRRELIEKLQRYRGNDDKLAYILMWDKQNKFYLAQIYQSQIELKELLQQKIKHYRQGKHAFAPTQNQGQHSHTEDRAQKPLFVVKTSIDSEFGPLFLEIGHRYAPLTGPKAWLLLYALFAVLISWGLYTILPPWIQKWLKGQNSPKEKTSPKTKDNPKTQQELKPNFEIEHPATPKKTNGPLRIIQDDTIQMRPEPSLPPIKPGTGEVKVLRRIQQRALEQKPNDVELEFDETLSLRLGRGREQVKVTQIDLGRVPFVRERQRFHRLSEELSQFEKDIRSKSDLHGVSGDIMRKLASYFDGVQIILYLRNAQEGDLEPLVEFSGSHLHHFNEKTSQESPLGVIPKERLLHSQLHHTKEGFFNQDRESFWQPLITNGIFVGALRFIQLPGQKWPANLKSQMARLAPSIALSLFHFRLYEMAITDPLTGAYSKRHFIHELHKMFYQYKDSGQEISLIAIDLDHFKEFNDRYGHSAGDMALKFLAHKVQDWLGEAGNLYRYGGEEFTILLPQYSSFQAEQLAEQIRQQISESPLPTESQSSPIYTTISLGLAPLTSDIGSEKEWFEHADHALYQAKEKGRNNISVYGDEAMPRVSFARGNVDISSIEGREQDVIPGL